jgi:hypothetical protein
MEEADELAWVADKSPDIGSFRNVAAQTGQGEIRCSRGSPVFAAHDVIDVESEVCVRLVDEAVFAEAMRALDDRAAKGGRDGIAHAAAVPRVRLRTRARALARLIT